MANRTENKFDKTNSYLSLQNFPLNTNEPSSSTMAPKSDSTKIPTSPPPQSIPPPLPPQSSLRDPFYEDIPQERNHLEERVHKRRRIEENQDKLLIHGFELKSHVTEILESNDLSSLQDTLNEFTTFKKPVFRTIIIDSFSLHYPNAFSFKLAKLLQSQPPLQIRTTIVSILRDILKSQVILNSSILIELKNPLLDSVKVESDESLLPQLCGVIGLAAANLYEYSTGGWVELLEYVCTCVSGDVNSNSNFTKGLMLLAELPQEVAESREFWIDQENYDMLYAKLLKVADLVEPKFQGLMFDASMTLIAMSQTLEKTIVCDSLLQILLEIIDRHKEEESMVLPKIKLLADLVTMDIGKIFEEKERDVLWCMIGVAEVEEASEEIRIAAVNVIKELDEMNMDGMHSLMKSLSAEEVKRVLAVAMGMMLCFVEDPIWYEVDNKDCEEAGMTESFCRGRFLLFGLCFDGNQSVAIPIVVEMLSVKYACHNDWRARFAAMITIGLIAPKFEKMIQHLKQVVTLVVKSLQDTNHRVAWATIDAVRCLGGLLSKKNYHLEFLTKLAPIIKSSIVDRLVVSALAAIRSLIPNYGLQKMSNILEELLRIVLFLFKLQDKQKVQLEAIETLQSIAVKIPITFRESYYDQTIIALKECLELVHTSDYILLDTSSSNFFLRAKCLECMANLVRKFEQDKFKDEEADVVMDCLVILDGLVSHTDHITRIVILQALDQFCRCPRVNVDRFIDKVMPMLLRTAQLDTDLAADTRTADSESYDENEYTVEFLRVQACKILSYCSHRSFKKFSPHISQVTKIFERWIGCSCLATRWASVSALPNILLSIKVSALSDPIKLTLTHISVDSLINALRKETDSELSAKMLKLLSRCILISGSFFNDPLLKSISDVIRRIMNICFQKESDKADQEISSELGGQSSSGRSRSIPIEETTQDQIFLISTTIETFRTQYLPYVDDLMRIVSLFLDEDVPDRVTAISLAIFNIIVPHFPQKLPEYIGNYIFTACHVLKQNWPHSRLHGARAIGICAEFGIDRFRFMAKDGFSRLSDIMKNKNSVSNQYEDVTMLCDTAAAALGKICEFQRETIVGPNKLSKKIIEGPMVVRNWLDFLPVKSDFNEARYAHGLLCKMIQRSDKDLFGDQNENLAKIILIVKEILSRPDRMATKEDIDQMIDFINQHGGMEINLQ